MLRVGGGMDEKKPREDDDTPETAEPPEAEKVSERVPEEVSGEGDRHLAHPMSIPTRRGRPEPVPARSPTLSTGGQRGGSRLQRLLVKTDLHGRGVGVLHGAAYLPLPY